MPQRNLPKLKRTQTHYEVYLKEGHEPLRVPRQVVDDAVKAAAVAVAGTVSTVMQNRKKSKPAPRTDAFDTLPASADATAETNRSRWRRRGPSA